MVAFGGVCHGEAVCLVVILDEEAPGSLGGGGACRQGSCLGLGRSVGADLLEGTGDGVGGLGVIGVGALDDLDSAAEHIVGEVGHGPLAEAGLIGGDGGNAESHTFEGGVAPRLVVAGENGGVDARQSLVVGHIEHAVASV